MSPLLDLGHQKKLFLLRASCQNPLVGTPSKTPDASSEISSFYIRSKVKVIVLELDINF